MGTRSVPQVCIPGERLYSAAEGYSACIGCYEINGYIHASCPGFVRIKLKKSKQGDEYKSVEVRGRFEEVSTILPQSGSIVTARVESVSLRQAKCSIMCVADTQLADEFSATLRKEDVRDLDKDKVELYKCVQPGDIILARVIGVGDTQSSFLLSISESELGVVHAVGVNGQRMLNETSDIVKEIGSDYSEPRKCAQIKIMAEESEDVVENPCPDNPFNRLLNIKTTEECPPNFIMLAMFSGRFQQNEILKTLSRPRLDDGSLIDELQMLMNDAGKSNLQNMPTSLSMSPSSTISPKSNMELRANGNSSSRGYVIRNGTTWVRNIPEHLSNEPRKNGSTPKRFGNQSLIIANGKRIYAEQSNECIAFAQNGKCSAASLCLYEHNGSSEHRNRNLCRFQMMGMCRNANTCPSGAHLLEQHQMPVCSYFLRVLCAEEYCPYLHVKHTESLDYCLLFQKGNCFLGAKCLRPHRYDDSLIHQRCGLRASGNENTSNDSTNASFHDHTQPVEWHF